MALLGLASLRVMTHLLEPGQYGVLALLAVFQTFAGLVLMNPVGQYLNRHTHQWHDDGTLSARLKSLSRYWLAGAAIVGFLAAVWLAAGAGQTAREQVIIGGFAVLLAVYTVTQQGVATARLNMLGERRASVTWQLAGSVVGLTASWALTAWQPVAVTWLIGQGLGAWLGALGAERAMRALSSAATSNATGTGLREMFRGKEFLPLALTTSLMWMEGNGYRLILDHAWNLETLGLLILALSIPAQLTAFVEQIASQLLYPYFFRGLTSASDVAGRQKVVRSMVNTLLPVYLAWGAFLFLGARPFLELVTDPRYHAAGNWVVFGIITELARLSVSLWLLNAQANRNFTPAIAPFAVGAAFVTVAAFATQWAGATPDLFGTLLAAALVVKAGLVILLMNRILPISLELKRTTLFVVVLAAGAFAYGHVPVSMGLAGNFVFLAVVFLLLAVAAGIHLRTCADARLLFSHRLNPN
jgi:hypothetical protein